MFDVQEYMDLDSLAVEHNVGVLLEKEQYSRTELLKLLELSDDEFNSSVLSPNTLDSWIGFIAGRVD